MNRNKVQFYVWIIIGGHEHEVRVLNFTPATPATREYPGESAETEWEFSDPVAQSLIDAFDLYEKIDDLVFEAISRRD